MIRIEILFLFIFFGGVALSPLESFAKTKIHICQDEAQWPPFAFKDAINKKEFAGLSFEVVQSIFNDSSFEAVIAWMPWSRCLGLAQKGEVDVVLDLYHSVEREKFLDYSLPYFRLNSSLFYLPSKRTKMQNVKDIKTLEGLRACGRREFDYSHFKIRDRDFVAMANSYEQLYQLLLKDRCDYFPEEAEIIAGLSLTGKPPWPAGAILKMNASWVRGPEVHWGVSKKSKHRSELLKLINSKFSEYQKSPEKLSPLKKKYGL